MDMILSHDWTGKVFHPNTGQCVPTDLIVFVCSLSIIGDIEANIFTITNIAMPNHWVRAHSTDTNSGTDCKSTRFSLAVCPKGVAIIKKKQ